MSNNLAVSLILGVIFSDEGPGYSKLNIFSPDTPSKGNNAIVKITIPKPPNHCKNERHKSILLGIFSMSVKIVAPVVVTPETASNNAFEYPSKALDK